MFPGQLLRIDDFAVLPPGVLWIGVDELKGVFDLRKLVWEERGADVKYILGVGEPILMLPYAFPFVSS